MKQAFASLVLIVIIALVVVFKFSTVETNFECKGKISANNKSEESTIYIKVNEYRPWVGLWSDADGDLKFEIPNQHLGYYTPIKEVGDQLQIYDGEKIAGNFSKLSKVLALKVPTGFFDGSCTAIEK
jgi:ABC-type cobalt transport system substrate-binding protein